MTQRTHPPGGFLSRWSRLKHVAQSEGKEPPGDTARSIRLDTGAGGGDEVDAAERSVPTSPVQDPPATTVEFESRSAVPNDLPPLESVSVDTDFTPFMQEQVPALLRRQALRALFRDPHFNRMDGLDVYIDDYTQFEPIPPEMLDKLAGWRAIKTPVEHVVTPGGYAVEADSEEGQAVIAARANAATALDSEPTDDLASPAEDAGGSLGMPDAHTDADLLSAPGDETHALSADASIPPPGWPQAVRSDETADDESGVERGMQ